VLLQTEIAAGLTLVAFIFKLIRLIAVSFIGILNMIGTAAVGGCSIACQNISMNAPKSNSILPYISTKFYENFVRLKLH